MKIYASEDGFEEIQRLVTGIHQLTNAHIYQDLKEMTALDVKVQLETLKNDMEELIS